MVFSNTCLRNLSAGESLSLLTVSHLLFLFIAFKYYLRNLQKTKNPPQIKGRVLSRFHPNYRSIIKLFCHSIPLTLVYGFAYLSSAINSEVVFNNACLRNLSAGEFLSLLTVSYLLFLFIAFSLKLFYSKTLLLSTYSLNIFNLYNSYIFSKLFYNFVTYFYYSKKYFYTLPLNQCL